jgi:hypothetical protein
MRRTEAEKGRGGNARFVRRIVVGRHQLGSGLGSLRAPTRRAHGETYPAEPFMTPQAISTRERFPIVTTARSRNAPCRRLSVPNANGLSWGEQGIEYDASFRAVVDAPDAAVVGLLRLFPTLSNEEQLAVAAALCLRAQARWSCGILWSPVDGWLLRRAPGWGGAIGSYLCRIPRCAVGMLAGWVEDRASPRSLHRALAQVPDGVREVMIAACLQSDRYGVRTKRRVQRLASNQRDLQRNASPAEYR